MVNTKHQILNTLVKDRVSEFLRDHQHSSFDMGYPLPHKKSTGLNIPGAFILFQKSLSVSFIYLSFSDDVFWLKAYGVCVFSFFFCVF